MEYIIVTIIVVLFLIIVKTIFGVNFKEIKQLVESEKSKKLVGEPDDFTNKILIANVRNSYTRIQTIAHECLHSIQGRKILMSNFIFSNIYLLYFGIMFLLTIFKVLPFKMLFLVILIFLSMIYILIRNYLENDAMTKAKYLAKDYMEDIQISTKEEIKEIVDEFEKINHIGIRATNYHLFLNVCIKIILFCIICAIF